MFTIRDLKPRGPRGCFKIMKAARIDTRANLRDRFILWEPLPNGKVKVSRGAIQYSPEKYPENYPEKCPELCNCSNSYFLNFLVVDFEGVFGILFGTVLNCTPDSRNL